ncbi:MAG: hypothetical protein M1113_03835 [Candidatus Thermoplasmatota archaeon]|nr:hypothetical protein [Candidatus Thermoplasmatota archaeon]
MGFKKEHQKIYDDNQVNRWYLNLRARSPISADIRRRNLALYCDLNDVSPKEILYQAKENKLKNEF